MSEAARRPLARVLSIGDELLRGSHADLNAPFLLSELSTLGFALDSTRLVSDDPEPLERAMAELCAGAELVITSGGLGPTLDDVTREAAARVAGVDLVEAPGVFEAISAFFVARGKVAPESNRRQAMLPVGADLLANEHGTAPGFAVTVGGCLLVCLPGPPRELQPMFREVLIPRLRALNPELTQRAEHTFHLANLSESIFAERCGDWMAREADPVIGVSAKRGTLTAHLVARGADGTALLERTRAFRERFEAWILYEGRGSIEARLVERLGALGRTLAVAESCTGGRIAARVTAVPGASQVFGAGWVTYSNGAKHSQLGVPQALFEAHGAVSREVAAAMARGAVRASGADLAVSVTGIAGPGGGSPEKPVGLVIFGLCLADPKGQPSGSGPGRPEPGEQVWTLERKFTGATRERLQDFATRAALELALRAIDGKLLELGLESG